MKKIFLSLSLLAAVLLQSVNAQMSVGTSAAPNANAVLDLVSGGNRGLLLPRVALTSTTAYAPLTAWVAGMEVYNTATAGDVTPGIYYCDGNRWIRTGTSSITRWRLSSNSYNFTETDSQLTGTSSLPINELGCTTGTNTVTIPAGRYLIFINGDIPVAEYVRLTLQSSTGTIFMRFYYIEGLSGTSVVADFTTATTLQLNCKAYKGAGYDASTGTPLPGIAQPPYTANYAYEVSFLKLK